MRIDIPEAVREAHADLGPLALELLDHIAADPANRARPLAAELPEWMSYYHYPRQPWPTLLGGEKRRAVERATAGLTRLVKAVPERLFGDDPKRLAAFYRLGSEVVAGFLLLPPSGIPGAVGRCDMLDAPDGFKCLELNMSANIGGWELRFAEQQYRREPMLAEFFAERGVAPVARDPWQEMLGHAVAEVCAGPCAPAGEINVAVVTDVLPAELLAGAAAFVNQAYAEVIAAAGRTGRVVVTSYPGGFAAQRGMRLTHGGLPVHAVIEHCNLHTPQEVYRCFKAETIRLYNGPLTRILSDKRNLALLSEHAGSGRFDAEEQALIAAHVPWSRVIEDKAVTWQDEEAPLRGLLLRHQECFVVKPAEGMQGDGVAIGARLGREAWEEAVAAAFREGSWIAQEAVRGRPHLGLDGTGSVVAHDVVWGTFSFGDRYGGGFLRLMPCDTGDGVINSSRGATEGFLFEV